MLTSDFNFILPEALIAQHPASKRDQSRLLAWDRNTASLQHHHFPHLLNLLHPGDLLVTNDSKVIPARLRGLNPHTGGGFELLLLEENQPNDWWAMMRPAKRAPPRTRIHLLDTHNHPSPIVATVMEQNTEGHRRLTFEGTPNLRQELHLLGETPLPPYIRRHAPLAEDTLRYQTVYAREEGSVAAPTAGLHFTRELLEQIARQGVTIAPVTLHVGPGTFAPVKSKTLSEHVMHLERYSISASTAAQVNAAKQSGRRVVAVGTTSLRVLESAAQDGSVTAGQSSTRLFVHPPCHFKIVDALLTNFHLPGSTLLMLVSAFLTPGATHGREQLIRCYNEAVQHQYRFFSYGDAMFIS